METWLPIPGYEGRYEVSSLGRVKSLGRPGKGNRPYDRIRAPAMRSGYRIVPLDHRMFQVHRLVAMAFMPGAPEGWLVDHIDRDKLNNSASNLRWVPWAANVINQAPRAAGSGVNGVGWHAKAGKWRARIGARHLGLFTTREAAEAARKAAEHDIFAHADAVLDFAEST